MLKGEVAVVPKKTNKENQPVLRVLLGAQGKKLEGFPKRNATEPIFQIVNAVPRELIKIEHDFRALWASRQESAKRSNRQRSVPMYFPKLTVRQREKGDCML